ncbi:MULTISPECIES: alanyl-tRNA editing protein [Citrobacter]|jgi:Ser-tRNA(Ala) deacylase AlaX|uniref:Alanyl-tRNA editing protein n=1 Tax=Citrobacter gillenii TaxID=67828 RepID=A0ABD6M1A5_9ENTR|nr:MULTISPECIES: alanyl-tRNA editing protein [Citrobacter]MBD0825765.1 alanyl-tRNA editing protein [Citrobacter sp. C1]NTZ50299.1 alanyl-tRNA editing protein [Citrobacter gillenii]QCA19943.1 alanyl-tRNA editing protein [Citrobacter freundii]RFU92163.1 alanyl-tRNA editing protein [Citrobacter gillenii]
MTERLYYTSDDTRGHATITHCTAEPDGRYAITLDSTLFHPQGGGQPSDSGAIGGVPVEGVMTRGEEVVHIVAQPLPPGETTLHIDAAVRHLHARLHSAGHMIGQAGEIFGWRPVKAHHWPNEGRITFAIGEGSTLPEAAQLMAKIGQWQTDNLARRITFDGGLRQVGFGDLPGYPCGGTHVARLSELGEVIITQVKLKKGQMVVSYTLAA